MYTSINKANRQLYDYKFSDVPFYFGKVMETDVCFDCHNNSSDCVSCESKETLEHCYKCGNCKGCSVIDISYVDTLVAIPEEEDSEGIEILEEDEEISKSFELLSSVIAKGK